MYKLYLSSLLFTLFSLATHAHTPLLKRTCATHEIEHNFLKENFSEATLQNSKISGRANLGDTTYSVPIINSDTTYTVQVVVHVVYFGDNKYENVSDEIIQSQIDALNRDFNLENDISHIRPEFLQFIGNPKIRFELAKETPKGKPTNGITRTKGNPILVPDWNPILDNIKNPGAGGVVPWAPRKYLNIWVCDLNYSNRISKSDVDIDWGKGALGGYANPPQGLPNWKLDLGGLQQELAMAPPIKQGVVIDFRFFGQDNEYSKDYLNSSSHYNMGRTTVHEVGHFLGLRHTWGDYSGLLGLPCEDFDDGIIDTPHEDNAFSSYIEAGDDICSKEVNSCFVPYPGDGVDYPDMQENYMNYSTDICYGMFTREQANMMRYALTNKRAESIIKSEIEDDPIHTGIRNKNNLRVEVYPNPASTNLNISLEKPSAHAKVFIYNTLGEVVVQKDLTNQQATTLSIAHINSGAYILYVEDEGKTFSKQFIKQ